MGKLDPRAVAFFYGHAGTSYDPATETADEGKMRGAMALARAERWAQRKGMTFEWGEDWEIQDHVAEFDGYDHEPETCEFVMAKSRWGVVVGSLGCVDDATDAYRRVVEAELALEAMGRP